MHIYKIINATASGGGGGATAFNRSFNSSTDWGVAVNGLYTITIPTTIHNRGTTPIVQVSELILGEFKQVDVDTLSVDDTGNVEIRVTENLDTRFEGRITILGE